MIVNINRNCNLLGVTPKRDVVIHNVQILDASGSMLGGKYNAALAGINKEIEQLKDDKSGVHYKLSVIEFDSGGNRAHSRWTKLDTNTFNNANIMPHHWLTPIEKCGAIRGHGAAGGTPLYYTIYEVLQRLRKEIKEGESAIVTILTDGDENTSPSRYKDGTIVRAMIEEYKAYGINVTFMGTQEDIDRVVYDTHIDIGNTFSHMNDVETINTSYRTRSASLTNYSKSVMAGGSTVTSNFFAETEPEKKEEEKKKAEPKAKKKV